MADNSYNISIETKAQLEEIQNLLAELRAINAEISKINGQTFSAVNASAAELSNTGKTLATAVQEQRKAFEEVSKSSQKASGALEETGESSNKLKSKIGDLNDVIDGFNFEIGAMISHQLSKLPSAFTASIKAFGKQETAVQKLSAAIRSNGSNVSELLPIMQRLASEIQSITTYGDEQVLAMQAMASSMGVNSSQMEGVIKNAIGLSTALNMDVMTAVKASSAAIQGKTTMLQEYIPSLSKCTSEEEKLAKVQALGRSGFNQAEEAANTLEGKLIQAANAWGDLQEVVGEAFAPTIKIVATFMADICKLFSEHTTLTKSLSAGLASVAVGLAFTKIGGLASVARAILGVSTSTKAATAAMHGFNAAIKANPIGLIATAATLAITGLAALCDSISSLTEEEQKEIDALKAEGVAIEKSKEARREASRIIDDYNKKLAIENETLADVGNRTSKLAEEIANLEKQRPTNGEEELARTKELVKKKEELAASQKKYSEMLKLSAELKFEKTAQNYATMRYSQEKRLIEARKNGLEINEANEKAFIDGIAILEKSLEIQKKYYADHSHLVRSEEDRNRIMAEAEKYAEAKADAMFEEDKKNREIALSSETALKIQNSLKDEQSTLELEILRSRASGNESLAKDQEKSLRISQLTSEIFESTRKEGMSRKELESLQENARRQAEERFNLEKSVTDEIQRQNLAKNAQAKIEDILITNKIEQLKAEGKIAEAKELEHEREIKRTLAGLEGVSDENKKRLAKTMRQTNDYRERQETSRDSVRSPQGYSGSGTGGYSSGTGRGTTAPKKPRLPATLSDKNIDLYNEWKEAGGEKGTGKQWMDYRDNRNAPQKRNPKVGAQARGFLASAENTAGNVAGISPMVGGALQAAAQSVPQTPQAKSPTVPNKPEPPKPAASAALNNKLESMGVKSAGKDESVSKINDTLKGINDTLKDIKSTVSSLGEKK